MAELDIDTATHLTGNGDADEPTIVQTEEPDDDTATTKPKGQGTEAAETKAETAPDVSLSVEVSDDEDNSPD
jgi:hypothetical protein